MKRKTCSFPSITTGPLPSQLNLALNTHPLPSTLSIFHYHSTPSITTHSYTPVLDPFPQHSTPSLTTRPPPSTLDPLPHHPTPSLTIRPLPSSLDPLPHHSTPLRSPTSFNTLPFTPALGPFHQPLVPILPLRTLAHLRPSLAAAILPADTPIYRLMAPVLN
ncbi:hypothetical protein Pcinc_030073 [Petrolisthes cinctipes]|uniref:Uncharacterized protein n=1 Tax=Petrolisthes cinctipes TaxID=88211 RepID=A0AAE1EZ43_PETCI|nr:hypothetical protein Pcinc_030073 [Petrolisthes cinctipes]